MPALLLVEVQDVHIGSLVRCVPHCCSTEDCSQSSALFLLRRACFAVLAFAAEDRKLTCTSCCLPLWLAACVQARYCSDNLELMELPWFCEGGGRCAQPQHLRVLFGSTYIGSWTHSWSRTEHVRPAECFPPLTELDSMLVSQCKLHNPSFDTSHMLCRNLLVSTVQSHPGRANKRPEDVNTAQD